MDEGVGDEVAATDAVGGKFLRGKDGEYSREADGAMLESHEMIIPSQGQFHGGSSPAFPTILKDKNPDIGGFSRPPYATHCTDDAGVMIEELTLRNCSGENLAIVGTSKNKDLMQTRQNPWQHLYQIAGGLGSGSSREDALYKDYGQPASNAWEDVGYTVFSEFLGRKPPDDGRDGCDDDVEHVRNNENKFVASNMSPAGIRTKILSKSGFSEYFVKNSLNGKGIIFKGPAREGFGMEFRGKTNSKAASTAVVACGAQLSSSSETVMPLSCGEGSGVGLCVNASNGGVSLRDWLKAVHFKANKVESLYIFRQIVDFVDFSHSQGVALQDLRPSCFKLLRSNQVVYLGSPAQQEIVENPTNQYNLLTGNGQHEKRLLEQAMNPAVSQLAKKQKFGENLNYARQWPSKSGFKTATANDIGVNIIAPQESWDEMNNKHNLKRDYKSESNCSRHMCNTSQLLSTYTSDPLEEKWYSSPEEHSGRGITFSSNIYVLGVLLFELLGSFDSEKSRAAAMSDLHHRILPPSFLSENPKEAGFCLWLLHPEPSSRPTARDVLQSDLISGIVESFGDEFSSSMNEDDTESDLLLHFLLSLKEEKQKDALKLVEELKCLETDIEEVERRQTKKPFVLPCTSKESLHALGNRFQYSDCSSFTDHSKSSPEPKNELRLMKNIGLLESAYFSTRSNIQLSGDDAVTDTNKDLLEERHDVCQVQKDEDRYKPTDHLGAFFSGFCKYARYSKFKVRGTLRNGDFHNSPNVICSLSFDRDQEYFAAAGVSKRIKVFEFQELLNESVDIHYPAIEMSNKSKLSCVCWNSYIRNYLASTDYDGIVKLWDARTGQGFSHFIEHNKRAWSVDFCQADPTRLASGSDDCSVKLWNINERNSLCTIRSIANVCCVQFSPHSTHSLAFGSADYKTYCYDLRNVSSPWCILAGHDKAVSYVKFLDSQTLISASTDNTLKLWDLNSTSSSGLSTTASILTLNGHTNEKNFVGLSVSGGYIACGSETNEVYTYYRSLPMPITSHKFGSIDPITGKETDDDNGQFVSSVCWRKNSDMLVAANSTGCIKVLQMV